MFADILRRKSRESNTAAAANRKNEFQLSHPNDEEEYR